MTQTTNADLQGEFTASEPDQVGRIEGRLADIFASIIAESGVEVVFGLPGGTISPLYDALLDHPNIRVVTAKHETDAMFAAAGYARTSGRVGVVLVTSGPGILNALTGLATAHCDGAPVLLIAGEVSRATQGRGGLQDGSAHGLDVIAMCRSISKHAVAIPDARSAPFILRDAIREATTGRQGPIALTLPLDVATETTTSPIIGITSPASVIIDPRVLDEVAQVLAESERPLLFAGAGLRDGAGAAALLALATHRQIPVMTTPKGKGVFPEDHPLSLGVFGMGGHPSATKYLEDGVDVVLALGTRMSDLSTNGWSRALEPTRRFIHVDIEASHIGRAYPVHIGVVAPVERFLLEMMPRLSSAPARPPLGVTTFEDAEDARSAIPGRVSPARVLWELQRVLPLDTIFTVDSGEHYAFAMHYLRATLPDGILVMSGLGSMGSGICGALGAQLARPDRRVAAVCGDGGLLMCCGELVTAVEERLPIVFVVFNDHRLGMVELGHLALYGRTPRYSTGAEDLAGVARALGAEGHVVDRVGAVLELAERLERREGPIVLDVRIDEEARMPRNTRFETLGAGKRTVTRSLGSSDPVALQKEFPE